MFKCTGNQLVKASEYARVRAAKRAVALGRLDFAEVWNAEMACFPP